MPKSQYINPQKMFEPGYIRFEDIPVNQYAKTIEEEKSLYTKADMMRIYRDMRIIREFETMLDEIKLKSSYNGVEHRLYGQVHLSIGQEASAVGEAYSLDINDFTFGSHRSHGEILAKGLSAIHKLSEAELYAIMEEYFGGAILRVVESNRDIGGNIKDLATDFLLYGALAEIFSRTTGFNKGLGGSMHAFFTPFGIYPNNAIVGGAAPIALGAAIYKRSNKKQGIVVANFGDGALGRGPVLEALNMSAMDQIRQLWGVTDNGNNYGLPILFNVFNNFYGRGCQTLGETMSYGMAARVGAGINPEQMHAERVNGYDPLAVIDAVSRKKQLLLDGKGPALLDVVTYRTVGHSSSDASTYRTAEELEAWRAADPIHAYKVKLIENGIVSTDEFQAMEEDIVRRITKICRMASDEETSPRMNLRAEPNAIADIMFSNEKRVSMEDDRAPDVLMPKNEIPRVVSLKSKSRTAFDANGALLPSSEVFSLRDGIFEAVLDKFYEDPTLIAYGEDNRDWGGVCGVYRGLTEALPYHRFFSSPISEAAIVGSAVGYAMCGGRAIVELMYSDFIGCAGDELFNQVAKWQAMSAGLLKMPIVVRVSVGSRYGAQHSQEWTALTAHIPGLKVVFPVTPYDAKGLMNAALSGTDPVIFFESQRTYWLGEMFRKDGVPTDYYEVKLGEPDIKREGRDLTILTVGATLYRALDAAKVLDAQYGISTEIIDARSIVPFDYSKVIESVKKTGRILIVGDGAERNSVMKDMAANITEFAFEYLKVPPIAYGSRNWITPAYDTNKDFYPSVDGMLDIIHQKMMPLTGYTAKIPMDEDARAQRLKRGV